jgi:hypothetical protein
MAGRKAAVGWLAIPGLMVGALALSSCGLFGNSQPDQPRAADVDIMANYARDRRMRPNVHAWQAARETLAFMRKRTSDFYGGVLATDWYRPKSSPDERLRVTVAIMSPDLKPQTIRVSVIKQRRQRGKWRDVPVSTATVAAIHDRIYKRALALKAQSVR